MYLGKGFELITDHHSLRWLESLNPENELGRRGRWLDFLQQFQMEIVPKKGRSPEMRIADYLSRIQTETEATISPLINFSTDEIRVDKAQISEEQSKCQAIQLVKQAVIDGVDLNPGGKEAATWRKPSMSDNHMVKEMWKMRDRLMVDAQGILRVTFNGGKRTKSHPFGIKVHNRIIIPESYKEKIMALVHKSATAAHMGITRTWIRARNCFWWPQMKQQIQEYIAACEECGRNKHVNNPNTAPAKETSIPGAPLEEVMVDFLGPFQVARTHNFRYIFQIQDVFSRFLVFVPTEDSQTKTAANTLKEQWVCLFGVPKTLRSDRGKHFTAEVFTLLCQSLGIEVKMGSPEHPQSQAQVERQNQLVNQLRCLCENNTENWPSVIKNVQCSHNASNNATSRFSPARLLVGKEFNLPEDLLVQDEQEHLTDTNLAEREEEQQDVLEEARKAMKAEQEKRIEKDPVNPASKTSAPYQVGDKVRYRLNDDVRSKMGGKIAPRYSEPYTVTEVVGNGYTYVIKPSDPDSGGRIKSRHFDLLKTVSRLNEVNHQLAKEPLNTLPDSHQENNSTPSELENVPPSPPDNSQANLIKKSTRERRPITRLQVYGRNKTYVESTSTAEGD